MSAWQSTGALPIEFYGRLGGVVPFPDEILGEIQRIARETPKIVERSGQSLVEAHGRCSEDNRGRYGNDDT